MSVLGGQKERVPTRLFGAMARGDAEQSGVQAESSLAGCVGARRVHPRGTIEGKRFEAFFLGAVVALFVRTDDTNPRDGCRVLALVQPPSRTSATMGRFRSFRRGRCRDRRTGWRSVNRQQTEAELEAVRLCVNRGYPLGDADWVESAAKQPGIESTLRPHGRPRNDAEA